MTINRIYIASDPLMTTEKEQYSNRRWLKDILERPVASATGLTSTSFSSSLTQVDLLNRRTFFEASGIEFDPHQTQFHFDDSRISDESLAYLSGFLGPDSLLIGYELSKQSRNLLSRVGVTYIDLWLHPVRFLDDILFAFSSNHPGVTAELFKFNFPEETYYLYADRIRVMSYKGWRRQEATVPADSALFVGQMLNDKSVCADGRMLSVLNFTREFEDLAATHKKVFYSRHPYLKRGDERIRDYLAGFSNVEIADTSVYRMLGHRNLRTVMSISSSVLAEAKYFGKDIVTLYRPVIPLANAPEDGAYASVLQDFLSPHFWSAVLAPVMDTQPSPRVAFLDRRDKVRDMLGFYWSYKEIDKLESLRSGGDARSALAKQAPKPLSLPTQPLNGQSAADLERFMQNAKQARVVSFDVFDTLIERRTDCPNAIFDLMEADALQITNGRLKNFAEARRASGTWAKETLVRDGEEAPLALRYQALAEKFGLSEEERDALLLRELEFERSVCRARFFGQRMFEAARQAGKRVVLITDTFFEPSFVEDLLRASGYAGWDALYASSEHRKLKRSGNLFKVVLAAEAVEASRLLHVGDDKVADVAKPSELGIRTFYVPPRQEVFERRHPLAPLVKGIAHRPTQCAVGGLLASATTDLLTEDAGSFSSGSLRRFGYCVLGPMFFGWAKWVLDQARLDEVQDLFFLARDGDIVKRCYDILASCVPDAPTSRYILASRRSVRVAGLRSAEDIEILLRASFTPMPLRSLLWNRFGVAADEIEAVVFSEYGYSGPDDRADWRTSEDRLLALFSDDRLASVILSNASRERAALVAHYRQEGLAASRRPGFVDIGHSGTLQAGIAKLMGLEGTSGYYFATLADIDERLEPGGHKSRAYLSDRIVGTADPYLQNILMFEAVFLNDQDSFLAFEMGASGPRPCFLTEDDAEKRKHFARTVHQAACDFCADFVEAFGPYIDTMELSGPEAASGYFAFLSSAKKSDALLFSGLTFENAHNGRLKRWLLPPEGERAPAIWKHGEKMLGAGPSSTESSGWKALAHVAITKAVSRSSTRLVRKFERDPAIFFSDSRNGAARMLGRFVYGEAR